MMLPCKRATKSLVTIAPMLFGLACSSFLGQRQLRQDLLKSFENYSRIHDLNVKTQNLVNSRLNEIETKQSTDVQIMMQTLAGIESRIDSMQEDLGAIKVQLAEMRYQATRAEAADRISIQVGEGDRSTTIVVESGQLLLDGRQALVQGDYASARASFEEFLRQFPVSRNRFEAHMGIADSYYREEKWAEALAAYNLIAQRYPADPRTPEALLKTAYCYQHTGANDRAASTLELLIRSYPDWPRIEQVRELLKQLGTTGQQLLPPA